MVPEVPHAYIRTLRVPMLHRSVPNGWSRVPLALGASTTKHWAPAEILKGITQLAEVPHRRHPAPRRHEGVGGRGHFQGLCAARIVARGSSCSRAMKSSVQQPPITLTRRCSEERPQPVCASRAHVSQHMEHAQKYDQRDARPRLSGLEGRHDEWRQGRPQLSSLQAAVPPYCHCSAAVSLKLHTAYHLLIEREQL